MRFVKVKSVATEPFEGTVHDLTVDGVHSYNVDGLAVHNSGAGSLVNYVLRITDVDPLVYNLFFERFLNKDRGHMPDIDSDFDPRRVSELFDHLNDLYGEDHCANVGTINYLQTKSVVKDVARVFGVEPTEANRVTKQIPDDLESIDGLLEIDAVREFFDKHPGMFDHVRRLHGAPRHTGQHPAGIIVTPMPITDIIPVHNGTPTASGKVHSLTAFDANTCEALGGVKFDLLAIDGLSSLDYQLKTLRSLYHLSGYLDDIPLDDEAAWDVICAGDTLGIWQMESPVGKGVIAKVQPRNMDELAAVNAFIRPGASGLEEYVAAKRDPRHVRRFHPLLDQHVASTYGAIVFQEQTMALIAELTDVSFGKADIVRRAVDKPKKGSNGEIIAKFREDAMRVAPTKGIPEEVVQTMIKLIIDGGGYGFNAAHAVCYAFLAYYGAYMKAHYPAVFYNSLINTKPPTKLPEIFAEARRHGVQVTGPNVSTSKLAASIDAADDRFIHAGLGSIKGLGPAAIQKIVDAQPFSTLNDFLERVGTSKTIVDAAMAIGAMETLPLDVATADLPADGLDGFAALEHEVLEDGAVYRVHMNRNQQQVWWAKYLEVKTWKPVKNVLVPVDAVVGKYLERFENVKRDLGVRKDGTFALAPHRLAEFGLSEAAVEAAGFKRTTARMKGLLAEAQAPRRPVATEAFIQAIDELAATEADELGNYLHDLEQFGVSFAQHPFEYTDLVPGFNTPFADTVEGDGRPFRATGIVAKVDAGTTRSGKPRTIVTLHTPTDDVAVWLWANQVHEYAQFVHPGVGIRVHGKRKFGAFICVDRVDPVPAPDELLAAAEQRGKPFDPALRQLARRVVERRRRRAARGDS